MAIPKVIYQTYYTTRLPLITRFFIWRMKKLNSEFQYEFYDDARIEEFLKNETSEEIFGAYKRITIGAAKADFFRYNILYQKGGVYLDIDSTIYKRLRSLISPNDTAIIAKERNPGMFVQWALVYDKGHPFLKRTIDKIIDNINTNRFPNDVHQMTGPSAYSLAIRECLAENPKIDYREVGVDYDGYFKFKHPLNKLLYSRKEHWKVTQQKQSVIH
ncbi:MAG TPA: glycosyltransferase [Cyclobacteriaceae bacterium]|nr:glycosyltransferase [Cyclobacteriaceae bacterium]